MDWAPLIRNYSGPLSIDWSIKDGVLIIRVRIPPDAVLDIPDAVPVIVTHDLAPVHPLGGTNDDNT